MRLSKSPRESTTAQSHQALSVGLLEYLADDAHLLDGFHPFVGDLEKEAGEVACDTVIGT